MSPLALLDSDPPFAGDLRMRRDDPQSVRRLDALAQVEWRLARHVRIAVIYLAGHKCFRLSPASCRNRRMVRPGPLRPSFLNVDSPAVRLKASGTY